MSGLIPPIDDPSYRGEYLGDPVLVVAGIMSDVHRELYQVHVIGNVVAVEAMTDTLDDRPLRAASRWSANSTPVPTSATASRLTRLGRRSPRSARTA
jgi:hypothetical protein